MVPLAKITALLNRRVLSFKELIVGVLAIDRQFIQAFQNSQRELVGQYELEGLSCKSRQVF